MIIPGLKPYLMYFIHVDNFIYLFMSPGFVNNLFGRGMWSFIKLVFVLGQLFKNLATFLSCQSCLPSLCKMDFKGKFQVLGTFLSMDFSY